MALYWKKKNKTPHFLSNNTINFRISLPIVHENDILFLWKLNNTIQLANTTSGNLELQKNQYLAISRHLDYHVAMDPKMLFECIHDDFYLCPSSTVHSSGDDSCIYKYFLQGSINGTDCEIVHNQEAEKFQKISRIHFTKVTDWKLNNPLWSN